MNILETDRLTRLFGSLAAVKALSITVDEGEVFGLLGPNGAGKTTVIKMLTTLLPPTQGTARICDLDIRSQSARVRRVLGYVPQAISADGSLTGYENLTIFAQLYDIPRRVRKTLIGEALDFMGLSDAADKLVRTYSGGMIRRLEIAQSMLHRPRLLFLDEPTTGLDPLARGTVWELLRQLREEYGTTIFLTTHLMEEADDLCTRVAIMNAGEVAALGSPTDLKASIVRPEATLDDVFIHYTAGQSETRGGYRETARTRRSLGRLG
jgi:ABC-2 type transport system ATP-binding protein